ncbi:MAG: ethanolamine ammonia-lyase subunit EutC [Candidatus Melainabacteria bacterium]|nr:ethanolamine ammonia-lyase subunit EutC [Candidatus Melainabacteria bacterium]
MERIRTEKETLELASMSNATPARIAVGRAGTRPPSSAWIRFRHDHAAARDAVHSELSEEFIRGYAHAKQLPVVQSMDRDRADFVLNPPKGKKTTDEQLAKIREQCPSQQDVQIVICDGLSALAIESNLRELLPMLEEGLKIQGITSGKPVVVHFGRVAIADQISHALEAKLAINLIGERPGLSSGVGMSAYLTYNPGPNTISSDRTVVSNIHDRGTPPVEAGAYIVHLAKTILDRKVSGVELQKTL